MQIQEMQKSAASASGVSIMNTEGTQDLEGSPFPQGSLERTLWLEEGTPATGDETASEETYEGTCWSWSAECRAYWLKTHGMAVLCSGTKGQQCS